jgi:hypothetical protein
MEISFLKENMTPTELEGAMALHFFAKLKKNIN